MRFVDIYINRLLKIEVSFMNQKSEEETDQFTWFKCENEDASETDWKMYIDLIQNGMMMQE